MATTSKYFKDTSRRATRNTPPTEVKLTSDPPSPMQPAKQPAEKTVSLENLFIEISKMNNTLQGVATDIITIKETTNELKKHRERQARGGGGADFPPGGHDWPAGE